MVAHMSAMVRHVACRIFGHVWGFVAVDGALWAECRLCRERMVG